MKNAFINTLTTILKEHEDAVIVTADMGFSVFEELRRDYPNRFFNTGVTEQASIGFSAGLALSGCTVFFYAQAAFSTMRCFEQVRLDVAYNFLNVKIIGVNAGVSLNQLGVSHFAIEDVALMRQLPGMTVLTPGDPAEMKWALEESYKIKGPTYIRFTKSGGSPIHKENIQIQTGHPLLVRDGKDAVLFVSGGLIQMAVELVELLKKQNIHMKLYSVPTVKPFDTEVFLTSVGNIETIFTLEEHSIIGGLGTVVAEHIAEAKSTFHLTRLGIPDSYTGIGGSIDYLLDYNGISLEKLQHKIISRLKKST